MRDENQIASGILRDATAREQRCTDKINRLQRMIDRPSTFYVELGRLGGQASVAKVPAESRRLNGLKGAIARWGSIRDNSTMVTRPKRLDMNQLAKRILDEATGDIQKEAITPRQENGRKGGLKGGVSRAAMLTPEQRVDIARTASQARWKKAKSD